MIKQIRLVHIICSCELWVLDYTDVNDNCDVKKMMFISC